MTTIELQQMISAVGKWAEYNFDIHHPELGIVEELGEFAHAQLKALQKIRPESSTEEKAKDAIGDATIFFFHYCFLHDYKLYEFHPPFEASDTYYQPLARCLDCVSRLLYYSKNNHKVTCQELWYNLIRLTLALNWDLYLIVRATWDEVKTRDWRKFLTNGKDA